MGDFPLCRLLLLNDRNYPWFILVPRRAGVCEIHHLSEADRVEMWRESARLSLWMESVYNFAKLNVAALGNIVSQLHLHHIGRSIGDPTWPGPVWGQHPADAYAANEVAAIRQQVKAGLAGLLIDVTQGEQE
jgi:diadenosine tetraphosphate (Ap4A) HIT family hydrolase